MPLHRSDGFAGQRLIVLPEPLRAQAQRHELLRALHVTDAGYFPSAEGHLVERPRGAPTTLVILCLRGAGWVERAGKRVRVEAGEFVWLGAHQAHSYGADEMPWTISWAHFAGTDVEAWRRFIRTCANTDDDVFKLPVDHLDGVGLDEVRAVLERGTAVRHQIMAATALRAALCKVGQLLVERHGVKTARERVAASVEMLRRDWLRAHRLEELATHAGMSVTHYCAHFRELTGYAPIDFIIRLRVREGCHLLDTTSLTVAEIAAQVGYGDPYYFTRCFRRVMGRSPRVYRSIPKG